MFGFFKRLYSQLAMNCWKPFEEVLQALSALNIVEKRLSGHSGSAEDRRTVHGLCIPHNRLRHVLIVSQTGSDLSRGPVTTPSRSVLQALRPPEYCPCEVTELANKLVVLGMAANPEPHYAVRDVNAESPVLSAYAYRPKLVYLLEMERRVSRVTLQKNERFVREGSHRGWKRVVAGPEVRSRPMNHNSVARPAL